MVGHKLTSLIGGNDMGNELMGKSQVESEIGKEEFQATLGRLFGGGVTGEEAHKAGAYIHSTAIASVAVREARGKGSLKVEMNQCARGR